MLDDLIDLLKTGVLGVLGVIGIAGVVLLFMIIMESTITQYSCKSYSELTGLETKWDLWGGCFVIMPDGKVVTKDAAERLSGNEGELTLKTK